MVKNSADQVDRALAGTEERRRLRTWPEYLAFLAVYWIGRLLPLDLASGVGGFVTRRLGPKTGRSRHARRHLAFALPELSDAEREKAVADSWDNFGRTMFEYGQVETLAGLPATPRVTVAGGDVIKALASDGRGALIASAHYGSWQVMAQTLAAFGVTPLRFVYRPANNPHIRHFIRDIQKRSGIEMIEKSSAGAREIIEILRSGGHVILLADQKYNDGISLPFFGREAMTSPALAELALRYDLPLVPMLCRRRRTARGSLSAAFDVIAETPIPLNRSGDKAADVAQAMMAVNACLERWIREDPGQWLWIHKRWGVLDDPKQALPPDGATG